MSLEQLIQDYGYLAVLVGTFLEGETILVLGGLAAHLGFLELEWVILSAFAGSFFGDQLYFYLGRHYGPRIIGRRLSWQVNAEKVYKHLHRHKNFLILTFRFYYGLRNVTPFAIGSSQVSRSRFFVLNFVGAVIWSVALAILGYAFGEAGRLFLDDFHRRGLYLLGAVVVLGMIVWFATLMWQRHKTKELK